LAMACTLRIAGDKAKLGMPEVRLGLIPGYGGTHRLPRLVGRGAALQMMLTGAIVAAEEALRLGLVQEVVPAAELMPRARAVAETIAAMAPLAVAALLEATADPHLDEGMRREAGIFGRLCGTEDKREGLNAFLEKRAAVWHSR